jgi:hypothetical protein
MIGASKILTVSYGTFSCTLEGFDEPFNTMKAIAEYFRDLAADDRYFGAEPPTPDAAMLHKIAEREVQRRVEAKIGENGVHLRAQEPVVAERPQIVMDAVPEPAALPTLTAMPEGVAARLAKIRASVVQGDAVVVPAAVVAEPEYSEDQHADESVEDMADFALFDDADIAPPETAVEQPAPEMDAFVAAVEDVPADDPALSDDDIDDDMLADLSAREAPIGVPDPLDAALDDMDAAEQEDAGFDMADLDLGADVAPVDIVPVDIVPVQTAEDDDLASRLGALVDPGDAEDLIAAEPMPEWIDDTEDDMLSELDLAEDVPVAVAAEAITEDVVADLGPVELAKAGAEAEAIAPEPDSEPALSDKIQRARARVIRIRRNPDIAAAPAAADIPEPVAGPTPALSVEAEADLERELAALEGEEPAPTVPAPTMDDDAELRRQLAMLEDDANAVAVEELAAEAPSHAAIADAVQDAAVSRLMQQTQSEMAVPENRRRLSAISHLKAAVAATVAERFGSKVKKDDGDATRAEPYRDDLARVVRPRRPESGTTVPARPAPLVLVSEQRIDRPVAVAAPATNTPGHISPVRPRRVSSAALAPQLVAEFDDDDDEDDDNIFADARGFAEFAERLGAHGLSDMLEAAAAYAATVEGRPHFTRPQLMRQVELAAADIDASREDGLRSFGAMLRDGRIIKVKRGQFALTEQSRFLLEAQKISD